MAAAALVPSGLPGSAVTVMPSGITGSARANVAAAVAGVAVSIGDIEAERSGAAFEVGRIGVNVERRKVQFGAARPRRERDIGADARGLAKSHRQWSYRQWSHGQRRCGQRLRHRAYPL